MLVRGDDLAATMSDYLIRRIMSSPRVTVHTRTEVSSVTGNTTLEEVGWIDRKIGIQETKKISSLFVMIGAVPNTEWLSGCVDLDQNGFVVTGKDFGESTVSTPYATTKAGVFAVGDVRAGSVKRVASSVGEGSVVISAIHQFLQSS